MSHRVGLRTIGGIGRGEYEQTFTLNCNEFLNNQSCRYAGFWRIYGTIPYLDAQDYATNYILNQTPGKRACCHAKFPDLPAGAVTISEVILKIYHLLEVGFGYFIDVWDGSSWIQLRAGWIGGDGVWTLETYDVTSNLNTVAKVNGAIVRFDHGAATGDGIYVDHVYLVVKALIR